MGRIQISGRGSRIRTYDTRFWRPVLYQAELYPYVVDAHQYTLCGGALTIPQKYRRVLRSQPPPTGACVVEGTVTLDDQVFLSEREAMGELWDGDPGYRLEPGPTERLLVSGMLNLLEGISTKLGREADTRGGENFQNDVFAMFAYNMEQHECACLPAPPADPGAAPQHATGCPARPNFRCGDVELEWYKRIGRGMKINRPVTRQEVEDMLGRCQASLQEGTI